jgi:hypothetical protein
MGERDVGRGENAYCFVSANFEVVLHITLSILPPYYWVVVFRSEELCNIFGPCLNIVKPFLAKDIDKVSLNSGDGGRSEMVTKDPKSQDRLIKHVSIPNVVWDDSLVG